MNGGWGSRVWIDGRIVEWGRATVHIATHSLHYGTSVFEGLRAYVLDEGGVGVFRLEDHMRRFADSARVYGIEIPYSVEELCGAVKEVIKANGPSDYYVRPLAFLNIQELKLVPTSRRATVAIAVLRWGRFLGKAYLKGARVTVAGWRRGAQDVIPYRAKAGGHYVLAYLASLQARARGFDEALLLDREGYVVEGSAENIFILKNRVAYTPPEDSPILKGITRDTVKTLLREELGIPVVERRLTLAEVLTADEAFFTGTAAEVTPVVEIDGSPIGCGEPGRVTRSLQRLYEDVVRGRVSKYLEWVDRV